MLKVFILVFIVLGVGFVAYELGVKSTPSINTDAVDTETTSDDAPAPNESKTNIDTKNIEPEVGRSLVLDLSGQGLTQTPKYVFDKTDIEKLDLSHNKLTGALQAEIRHLQNLKVLDLSNNQFTGVPAEIGQLNELEVLDLSDNNITGLPLELGNLTNLKVLNLKGNDYSKTDLGFIKEKLSASTIIQVD
jgi:Leucine-rich repeat (LRR) protein